MGPPGVQGRGKHPRRGQRFQGPADGRRRFHGDRPPRILLLPSEQDALLVRAVGEGTGHQEVGGRSRGGVQRRKVQEWPGFSSQLQQVLQPRLFILIHLFDCFMFV